LRDNLIQGLKFVLGIIFIPVVIAVTYAFIKQLEGFSVHLRYGFHVGIIAYLILHLFVFEPKMFYGFGHRLVSEVFQFFAPVVNVAPYVIPIYTLLLIIFYFFAAMIAKAGILWNTVYMFFISFTLSMHLIFTSRNLRESDSNVVKPNYIFSMGWIYILNLAMVGVLLDLVMHQFSFPVFFETTVKTSQFLYKMIMKQLFFS